MGGFTAGSSDWKVSLRHGRFQKHLAAVTVLWAFFSGFEALYSHYKSNFRYKAQWTPVLLAPFLMAAAAGAIKSRRIANTVLPAVSALALADGAVGFFYHARGIVRRPGGLKKPLYNITLRTSDLCSTAVRSLRISWPSGEPVAKGAEMSQKSFPYKATGGELRDLDQPGYYPGHSTLAQKKSWEEATRTVVTERVEQGSCHSILFARGSIAARRSDRPGDAPG